MIINTGLYYMITGIKFLAVLDYNFFQDNLYTVAEKIDGLADIIWFRFKNYDDSNIDVIMKNIRKKVNKSILTLSGNYILAKKFGFDGVHLNKNTYHFYDIIKSSTNLIIGYSSHSLDEINRIKADYYTLSPIYNTPKEYKVKPLGIIEHDKTKKVFALGGINLNNLNTIKGNFYGFAGIRVINDIINANF